MDEQTAKQFLDSLLRIANKTLELGKHAAATTPAGSLGFAEVSLITLIGQFNGINVTDLAAKYGATKGAISKMVKNLVQKNLVQKQRTLANEKEVLLSLTDTGLAIYAEKEAHLRELYQEVLSQLHSLNADQVQQFTHILRAIEGHLDRHIGGHSPAAE